jgi:hypothetical protein
VSAMPIEYAQTITFLAATFPTLAVSSAESRKIYHDTFKRAVQLRHGLVDHDFYDVKIAASVLADVMELAFAEFVRQ